MKSELQSKAGVGALMGVGVLYVLVGADAWLWSAGALFLAFVLWMEQKGYIGRQHGESAPLN